MKAIQTLEENYLADKELIYSQPDNGCYRKLLLHKGRLLGAVVVGEWSELDRLQTAVVDNKRLSLWQAIRFRRTGQLWCARKAKPVRDWPESTIVCQCAGITRGELSKAYENGYKTIEGLAVQTGAANTCLSCRPLIAQLINHDSDISNTNPIQKILLLTALLVFLLGFSGLILAPLPYSQSTLNGWYLDQLWLDSFNKQVSDFSLLGVMLFGALLSLRKRWSRFSLGNFRSWRIVHSVFGLLAIMLVILHTGMHTGEQLNFFLLICFILVSILGGSSAVISAMEDRLESNTAIKIKQLILSSHQFLLWPIPVLLGFHILTGYYY